MRIIAPILVHTCEEVWQEIRCADKAQSVHLTDFPDVDESLEDQHLEGKWTRILELRDRVLSALERARQNGVIGKPLESRIRLTVPKELYDFLQPYADSLASVFIVSQVELREGNTETIEVLAPLGAKCERCWLVLESVGKHSEHPTLCDRCVEALRAMER